MKLEGNDRDPLLNQTSDVGLLIKLINTSDMKFVSKM